MYDQSKHLWVLLLNRYQRDNLLWLLNILGYSRLETGIEPVEPFHLANTGDWVGEIAQALGEFDPEPPVPGAMSAEPDVRRPNKTRADLVREVVWWLESQKASDLWNLDL